MTLLEEISVLVRMSGHNKEIEDATSSYTLAGDPKAQEAIDGAIEAVAVVVKFATSVQEFVKSGHVEHAVERLDAWRQDEGRKWSDLFTRCCALREALRIEFREHLYFGYTKQKGQKYKDWANDWHKIVAAFPDVRIDAFAATDCYALDYPTASVFHSMRVAEVGLRALANERRIKLPKNKAVEWATWQETLKALDDEIKVIGQTWSAGSRKDAALEFYSGARADLNGFKDEFRNLVMHVRLHYDEFQALRALTRVHDFMARLAEKIDHQHRRIKWRSS